MNKSLEFNNSSGFFVLYHAFLSLDTHIKYLHILFTFKISDILMDEQENDPNPGMGGGGRASRSRRPRPVSSTMSTGRERDFTGNNGGMINGSNPRWGPWGWGPECQHCCP